MGDGTKRVGYWRRYDAKYRTCNVEKLYSFILSRARKLGAPFERKSRKGRPFVLSPCEYAATFIIATLFDLSLRDIEWFSDVIAGVHADHSTFGKAFAKIPVSYLNKLLFMTRNEIYNAINETPVLIADSTGVVVDRTYREIVVKCKKRMVHVYDKLHIIVEYYPDAGIMVVAHARAHSHSDATTAVHMLHEMEVAGERFFADAGYDAEQLYETCYKRGLQPLIKMRRSTANPKKYRRKAWNTFDHELYKSYRGVIEGVFGGLQTRRLLFSRYRGENMRAKHIIAMAIVQNLHTYMAILCIILICSTTPTNVKNLEMFIKDGMIKITALSP